MAHSTDISKTDRSRTTQLTDWIEARVGISYRKAALTYFLISLYLLMFVLPFVWLISSTLQTESALFSEGSVLFTSLGNYTLQNYVEVFSMPRFRQYLMNSIIVAVGTTTVSLTAGTLAAYSLSRFEYKGQGPILLYYLSVRMLPRVLILIPFFTVMFNYDLINTYVGIITAHSVIALPLVTWLLKGYFDTIPQSLDEAAFMDGCNHFQVMYRVILPLSKPGFAVAGFWAFTTSWNDYLFVSIIAQTDSHRTLAVGLNIFRGLYSTQWDLLLSGATVMLIPVLVLFFLIQQWIVEGIKGTGG